MSEAEAISVMWWLFGAYCVGYSAGFILKIIKQGSEKI